MVIFTFGLPIKKTPFECMANCLFYFHYFYNGTIKIFTRFYYNGCVHTCKWAIFFNDRFTSGNKF